MTTLQLAVLGAALGYMLGKVYPYQRLRSWVRDQYKAYRRWKFRRDHRLIK